MGQDSLSQSQSESRPLLVFTDTNALIAMLCFPVKEGKAPTLGQKLLIALEEGLCEFYITNIVAAELKVTVNRSFPKYADDIEKALIQFGVLELPTPDLELQQEAKEVCVDFYDAPVLASAIQASRLYSIKYLLSNDFETFHTDEMKAYLATHKLQPVSLYGLLNILSENIK